MLLSRKRAREPPSARGLLRDLRDAYGAARGPVEAERQRAARSQVRAELQRHNADADVQAASARLRSQELFLSVVLEWQRCADAEPGEFAWTSAGSCCSSSVVSDSEAEADDSDGEERRARQSGAHDGQLSRGYEVPATLPPLRLDCIPKESEGKKIGAYTPRARRELLRRYMAKRAKRLSQHTVRYRVRKTLANARPRVKGRFVKTQQPLTAAAVEAMKSEA